MVGKSFQHKGVNIEGMCIGRLSAFLSLSAMTYKSNSRVVNLT